MLKKTPLFGSLTGLLLAFLLVPQLALAVDIDLKSTTPGPSGYKLQYNSVKLSQDPSTTKCIAAFKGLKLVGGKLKSGTVMRFGYKPAGQEYKIILNESDLSSILHTPQDISLSLDGSGVCRLKEDIGLTVSLTPLGAKAALTGLIDSKSGLTIDSEALALTKKNAVASGIDGLPEFNVTLRVTKESDDTTVGSLSFSPVKDATVYQVYKEEDPGIVSYFSAGDLQKGRGTVNLDPAKFPNISATDIFVVEAYKGGDKGVDYNKPLSERVKALLTMIARGSTLGKGQGTVRALTEFGPVTGLSDYLSYIFKYALPIGAILSILVTMWAGVRVLFNPGSPEKTKAAFDDIKGTILGLVLLIFTHLLYQSLKIPITDSQRGSSPIIPGFNAELEGKDEPAKPIFPIK